MPEGGDSRGPKVARLTGLKKRQQIEVAGRVMFTWVAIAAVAVSFAVVASQYLFTKWEYNNKVISKKAEAANTLKSNIGNANELKREVDNLVADEGLGSVKTDPNDPNTKSILDALPTSYDSAAMSTSLQQVILARSGVTINGTSVPPDIGLTEGLLPTPQEIDLGFTVSGPYSQIKTLVMDLERTIRPITIKTVSLSGSDANMQAVFTVKAYYQPPKSVTITKEAVR